MGGLEAIVRTRPFGTRLFRQFFLGCDAIVGFLGRRHWLWDRRTCARFCCAWNGDAFELACDVLCFSAGTYEE